MMDKQIAELLAERFRQLDEAEKAEKAELRRAIENFFGMKMAEKIQKKIEKI